MARPAVIVALPPNEAIPVSTELLMAGFEVMEVEDPRALEEALEVRQDVALAILDGEGDPDEARAYEAALRDAGRPIAALTVVSPRTLERLTADETGDTLNEYFTRPYSADSIRWRVEAMCIRRETVDDGSGPILQGGDFGPGSLERARDDDRGVQPEGRGRQDDGRHQPRRRDPDAQGQDGPAHRCRHRDRPRHVLARDRRRPDRGRQLARRGRGRSRRDALRHGRRARVRACASSR